jgi:hypothetical protein
MDVFLMDDVPEAERRDTARQVAEKILPGLRVTVGTGADDTPTPSSSADALGRSGS